MARVVAVLLGLRHAAGHHRQPVLLVVAADHADGDARHPGGRGRRVRLGRRGDGLALRQGQLRLVARHAQPDLRRRRGPDAHIAENGADDWSDPRADEHCPTSTSRWARPPRTWRRAQGRHPRGDGRVRGAVAEPRREGDRERFLRPRDHAGHAAGRHRRQRRRRPAAGDHATRTSPSSSRCSGRTARVTAGNAARSTTAPPRWSSCPTRRPPSSGITPLARIVSTGVSALVPGDHGPRARSRRAGRRWPAPG